MNTHFLAKQFSEQMNEFTDTPFHIYPQEYYYETTVKLWVEQIELDEDTTILNLKYWDKTSGEEHTESYAAEVNFAETASHEYTVSIRILWNGEAAKAAFFDCGQRCFLYQ